MTGAGLMASLLTAAEWQALALSAQWDQLKQQWK